MIGFVLLLAISQAAPADENAVVEAKKYFEFGRQAYEATDYLTAVKAFEQANAIAPRAAIVFSMAQAYRQQYFRDHHLEHLKRAIGLYGDYLQQVEKGGRKTDAERFKSELEGELKLAEGRGAARVQTSEAPDETKGKTQLMISSRTPNATVSLDGGEPQEMPLIAEVEPGPHKVRVEAEGFIISALEYTAVEGRLVAQEVNLTEKTAVVRVSAPDGSEVSVDGRLIGEAPLLFPVLLRSGSHFVSVTDRGRHAFVRELSLDRGEDVVLTASLDTTAQRDTSYYFIGGGAVLFAGTLGTAIGAVLSEAGARFIRRKIDVEHRNISAKELEDYNHLRDLRGTLITASSGLLAGSIALGLTGGLLFFLDNPGVQSRRPAELEDPEELTLTPIIGDGVVGASLGASF